jgi:hypothetical protein
VCGHSAACYHSLNIAFHAGNALLVGALAASISKTRQVGLLAGLLFTVMPGHGEAVVWVACIPEVLATGFFLVTIYLFRRSVVTAGGWRYAAAMATFVACLLSHESGAALLPVLMLSMWLLPPDGIERDSVGRTVRMFVPFVLMLTVYLVVEYIINSRNYLVTEGQYSIGAHMLSNTLGAFATVAVTRHDTAWLVVFGMLALVAVMAPRPRIRFYALWIFITLAPVAGFRGGLAGRYLYLPIVGFAALTAEMLWMARGALRRWSPQAGVVVWWVVTIALMLRFVSFAVKNSEMGRQGSAPFTAYAARVRELYPAPARGAILEVPTPPEEVLPQYLPSLLQWEYRDPTLKPIVRDR